MIARYLTGAGVCGIAFVALGVWLTHHPLSRIDSLGAALRGTNVPLAAVLTDSGYGVALTVLGIAAIVAAIALRFSIEIPVTILLSQIFSQIAINFIKELFARSRPAEWLVRHEPGYSYPSGHATTAIVFYVGWLVILWNSPLPLLVRVGGGLLLGAWAIGIGWSRVALGAHYLTDVLGGVLFGVGWLCLTLAVMQWRSIGPVVRAA